MTGRGVRRAVASDAHAVQQILQDVHGGDVWSRFGLSAEEAVSHASHRVYVAFDSGQSVGCLIASGPEYTMLHSLSVLEPHRGRRHGTAMITAAVTDAGSDWGRSGMLATVAIHDGVGQARFERLGFQEIPDYRPHGLVTLQLTAPTISPASPPSGTVSTEPAGPTGPRAG